MARSLRLSTRLGISHGVLVALLVIVLVVTTQGLVRMLHLVVEIRDQRLSSVDAEEAVHRTAWKIEVAMRHGRATCSTNGDASGVPVAIASARNDLVAVLEGRGRNAGERLRAGAHSYLALAEAALAGDTCAFLVLPSTDQQRASLDEEFTDAWIDRLQELHADIQAKEDRARQIGTRTTIGAIVVALGAAAAAIAIARVTGRSVADPVRALAASATRLGAGAFAPIPDVKGPLEIEELRHDLERAREQLEEVERLKQSFIASVSHEMRSPLTSVREALCLLADGTCGPLQPKQRRVLDLAMNACEREVRLVEALLDLSRFNSGMPLKREAACDIDKVLDAAVEDERGGADERGVVVHRENGDPAPLLQIDSALVERAVANLVRNAVSVSRAGQRVRIVRASHDDAISIDVIDEGPGLEDGVRDTLFRPFAAAPVKQVGRPAGIGLGLSFAREVARAHGGDLTVPRSDERGTVFRMSLPVEPHQHATRSPS
jgi:two-component system sensor histidine kinase GlrK